MKATLGGYRHLVRKSGIASADAAARLKEILTIDLQLAFNGAVVTTLDVPTKPLPVLSEALLTLTALADRMYGKEAQETLWDIRLDRPLSENPGEMGRMWELLSEKIATETLDNPLSLVRVIDVLTHLGARQGYTLSEIADHSLGLSS